LDAKNAQRGSATVTVKLVEQKFLRPVNSVTTRIRTVNEKFTAPWSKAYNILPTGLFFEHSEEISAGFRERETEIDDFCKLYPSLAGVARERLGELDFERLWLPVDEVRAKFTHRVRHFPVPAGSDFRADMDENDKERIRQEMEQDIMATLQESMSGVRNRLVAVLTDFVERLKGYRIEYVDGKPRVRDAFRDSIMDGVRDIAEVLPKLNLTNDPALDQAYEGLVLIAKQDPDDLRENETARLTTLQIAGEVLKLAA
jgi:hypothetical protein